MDEYNYGVIISGIVAITLSAAPTLHATDNPFVLHQISKSSDKTTTLAEKMCGNNMEANCGANMPQGIFPDLLPEPTSKGAQLLIENCTQCHRLPGPGMHTAQEWPAVIGRMLSHISSQNKQMPENNVINEVIQYLQSHSSKKK